MTVPFMHAYTELLVAPATVAELTRSAEWRRSSRPGRTRGERDRPRQGARGQGARGGDGFDGTWVAHPDLVPVATEVFDSVLGERPNQVDRLRDDVVAAG